MCHCVRGWNNCMQLRWLQAPKPVMFFPGCNSEAIYFVSDYNGNQVRAFGAQSGASHLKSLAC